MAKQSSVNVTAATSPAAVYNLMTVLIAAGWTHIASSDGTTFSTVSNQITSAADLGNNDAFFVLQDPGGRRQYAFQRSTDANWLVLYSALDGFSSGGDATTVPSATDEVEVRGNGSRGAASLFGDTTGLTTHAVAESTPIGDVYPFWMGAWSAGTANISSCVYVDPLVVGSYPAEGTPSAPTVGDADPCVMTAWPNSNPTQFGGVANYLDDNTTPVRSWYKYNYAGEETFLEMTGYGPGNGVAAVLTRLASNPYNGGEDMLPIYWARTTQHFGAQLGHKGYGAWIKCGGQARIYPETVNLATDAYIHINDILLPWEDGTTPVL